MYIDDVNYRTVAIKMVTWLHYLNYEAIDCSLSGYH